MCKIRLQGALEPPCFIGSIGSLLSGMANEGYGL